MNIDVPNEIRRRMSVTAGDEFVINEVGPDTILLRKVDVRAMIQDAIGRAKSVDLKKLQKDVEEEGNRVARKIYQDRVSGQRHLLPFRVLQ